MHTKYREQQEAEIWSYFKTPYFSIPFLSFSRPTFTSEQLLREIERCGKGTINSSFLVCCSLEIIISKLCSAKEEKKDLLICDEKEIEYIILPCIYTQVST